MCSGRHKAGRLESAISISLIAVLFFIGLGIFIRQFDADINRFGIITETGDSGGFIGADLSSFLISGFGLLSNAEVYNSENLYEKINGRAPLYIESGFEKLRTQRFANKDSDQLWIELFIYDMADIRNAFSVYSVQKREGVEPVEGGLTIQFAYKTSNGVYFVHGKYYVELVGSAESAELVDAMIKVAGKITAGLAVDKITEIAELHLFPQENLVADSFRLYLGSVFGFQGLNNTFAGRYRVGGEDVTAFLSIRTNRQDALSMANSYYKFLIENGGEAKQVSDETVKGLEGKVVDLDGAIEIVFSIGPFAAGVHEAQTQQNAEKIAVTLIRKLSEAVKAIEDDRTKR